MQSQAKRNMTYQPCETKTKSKPWKWKTTRERPTKGLSHKLQITFYFELK